MAEETKLRTFGTEDQIKGSIRWIVSFGGGIAVGRGMISKETMGQVLTNLDTILPAIVAIAAWAWSLYSNTDKNLIETTGNLDAVDRVVVPAEVKAQSETLRKSPNVSSH